MPAPDPVLVLKGGLTIRTSVHAWLVDASFRLTFVVENGELVVRPRTAITAEDDRFIRLHNRELIAAVVYCETIAKVPL